MECFLCDKEVAYFITPYEGFCESHDKQLREEVNA